MLSWIKGISVIATAALLFTGCGDNRLETYPVSGTVEFADGSKVRYGTVEFVPSSGGPSARGKIDKQGRFVLGTYQDQDGAIAGQHDVVVIQPVMPAISERQLPESHAEHANHTKLVARIHADQATSGLSFEVGTDSPNVAPLVVKAE